MGAEAANFLFSGCRLGRGSMFHDCNEVCLALRATTATLKVGSLLDRKRHVVDVAVNLR